MTQRQLRAITRGAIAMCAAFALGGCFDLTQKVTVGRDGSGSYDIVITASGLMGDALKNDKDPVKIGPMHGTRKTTEADGKITSTTHVDFKNLSDLKLSDEVVSLKVRSQDLFGLGAKHVRFRRTFLVDHARHDQDRSGDSDEKMGQDIVQSMFGDHTYQFSVTLPGSVEHASTIRIAGHDYKPHISGDFYNGHTIMWRMPLAAMVQSRMLTFEVDFAVFAPSLGDAQSNVADKS